MASYKQRGLRMETVSDFMNMVEDESLAKALSEKHGLFEIFTDHEYDAGRKGSLYSPFAVSWHLNRRASSEKRLGKEKSTHEIVGSLGPKIKLVWGFAQCLAYLPIVFGVPWSRFMICLLYTSPSPRD